MRIAGDKVFADDVIEVFNPATGDLVGTVPKARLDDVRRAFAAARNYRATLTRYERSEILKRAALAVRSRTEEIANLITADSLADAAQKAVAAAEKVG